MANPLARAAARMDGPRTPRASFGGATMGRLYQDFNPGILSPDAEVRLSMRLIRARARMLVRDNPFASGFLSELANNVMGAAGVLLEAHVGTAAGAKAKATNQKIEAAWLDWSRPRNTCADRRTSWVDLQQLAIKTVAMDGECFLRKLPYFDNRHGFALQFIDADQVDETFNVGPSALSNEIRMGVEIDQYGAAVAYYVWSRQWSDAGEKKRVRVPASEMIHLFVQYRGQQTRGVSWFAPALLNLKMLDGYTEAELVAARTAAAKMGFIVTAKAEDYIAPEDGEEERVTEGAAGTIAELGPGQAFQEWDPKHPSVAFKDFTKAILRGVGRGLNMAYTTLTGDLEAVNYSSIRAGLLSERDQYRNLQRWSIEQLHDPVYDAWRPNALLTGALAVDSRLASDYSEHRWRARGWKWVDPKNDLLAAKLAIDLGLTSRSRLAAEQGLDWEEVVDELAHEIEIAEAAGVDVTGAPPVAGSDAGEPAALSTVQRLMAASDAEERDDLRPRLLPTGTGD